MKILIPIDGSDAGNRAVDHVIASVAWLKEAPQVCLLNVQWKVASGNVKLFINQDTINDYYREQGIAALADARAHAWLTQFFGEELRLVFMDERAERLKQGIWAEPLPVSFADAYPVLVATTGSLSRLNTEIERRGGAPVPMRRFRPNIVVDGADPWTEDFWQTLRIGGAEIELVKPSDRCVVTTKDQLTGATMGEEPLASLRRLRMSADPRIKGVLFGWNAAPRALGEIAVGDSVTVAAQRPEGFALHTAAEIEARSI